MDELAILGPRPPIQRGIYSRAHHEWMLRKIELEGGFAPIYVSRAQRMKGTSNV